MIELTIENIEEAIEKYFSENPTNFIEPLGNGLYRVGGNMICGENMLERLQEEIIKKNKEVRQN